LGPVSPLELFTGRKFDYAVDGRAGFGEYVIAPEPEGDNNPSSSSAARARLCITLCPKSNLSTNWSLMDIERGTFVTRSVWKHNPMPPEAIARLTTLAAADRDMHAQHAGDQPLLGDEDDAVGPVEDGAHIQPIEAVVGHAPTPGDEPFAVDQVEDDNPPPTIQLAPANHTIEVPEATPTLAPPPPPPTPPDDAGGMDNELLGLRRSQRIAGRRVHVYSMHVQRHLARCRSHRKVDVVALELALGRVLRE
jgi:hypothetical protein